MSGSKAKRGTRPVKAEPDDDKVHEAPAYRLVEADHSKRGERKGWMSASPLAILSLALTIAFNIGQMGFTYAYILGRLDANALATSIADQTSKDRDAAIMRAMEEKHLLIVRTLDEKHTLAMRVLDDKFQLVSKSVDRLDTAVGAMLQLRTDVEVMKNKLTTIDDTLRRVERFWDRSDRSTTLPSPSLVPAPRTSR